MNGDAPRAKTEGDALFGVALFLFALAPRLYAANLWAGEAVWDGHYYDFAAKRIAGGFGYSDDLLLGGQTVWHPWCHWPVGYSAFLAIFYRLFSSAPAVAHLVNAVTGALLPVVTWLLARRALSKVRSAIAGVLVAIHPGLILYSALVMSEPLAALLVLASFLVATSVKTPRRAIVLSALVLGFAALVRPQSLLCAPFLALVHGRAPLRTLVSSAVLACAVTLLPILPWTVRNCRVMDSCALVSTNGGWNLAIGSFPRATGRFETLRSSDGCSDVTGQVQQDRCWFAYGVAQIKAAPLRWLGLVPKKLHYTFDHESFPVEYLHESDPAAWPDDRRTKARELLTASERAIVALAAFGVVGLSLRRRELSISGFLLAALIGALFFWGYGQAEPTVVPLVLVATVVPFLPSRMRSEFAPALLLPVALLLTVVVTHAVFFGEDRYHLIVTPVFCLLAAGALRPPIPRSAPR